MDMSKLAGKDFYEKASPEDRAMELVWMNGAANLANTGNEIILPFNVATKLGADNVSTIANRLSKLFDQKCVLIKDPSISVYRIAPRTKFVDGVPLQPMDTEDHWLISREVHQAVRNGVKIPLVSPRIPRPPNSFILYRQHHHHTVTAENPGVQNTQISRIIAEMWRNETAEVRARFKDLADEKKRLHSQAHPNYQYAPRRPWERARRSPKIHASTVPFISAFPGGQPRLTEAWNKTNGWIDVDGDFIDLLDHANLIYGPNTVAPYNQPDNIDFDEILRQQLERYPLETVHWEPLQGNEFDDTFPIDQLLNLPGSN
ncbi:uncharacterized protein N7482_009426 [Penicillium canariense]|uniref:HMG box domain-containing protein n=1 Tax=Penicillium canariense TaxID=189055 RepID=A0A9W9LFU4_9EURO|nr:uncharacterized protein N7482_009426 [Penicillium canariense]KAJ5152948.1 hypothetical protein N7482_009426 [Penicillium canariense]